MQNALGLDTNKQIPLYQPYNIAVSLCDSLDTNVLTASLHPFNSYFWTDCNIWSFPAVQNVAAAYASLNILS